MTLGHEKLDGWGYSVKDERAIYKTNEIDFDPDETISQPDSGGNA